MSFRGQTQFPPIHNNYGNGLNNNSTSGSNVLRDFEEMTKKVEDFVDDYSGPFKPYIPAIGRGLIVATFFEDSLRIVTQWNDQVFYLWNYRHYWKFFVIFFLSINVVAMLVSSVYLTLSRMTTFATSTLIAVVLSQGVMYGLIFDGSFILRNLSVVGGLVLAYSDSLVRDRSLSMPGLPMINNNDNKKYFLLAGRILLVLLFIGFSVSSSWSFGRMFIILIGFVSCGSIIVGYKTKFAASILIVILFIYNVTVNHYWSFGYNDSHRDFLKYEFFQTLSIVGGLLIIVNSGAGELSFDEKKKVF